MALIVAILGVEEVHVPPLMLELKVVVKPTHTAVVPLKVPAFNPGVMVTVLVAVTSEQPPTPKMV